ncbi:MAG: hypothetical protein HRT72_10845, partial [Flavobacteriales bacterium]|nr:hypothetical protein [Flavobacteriales bacterium]
MNITSIMKLNIKLLIAFILFLGFNLALDKSSLFLVSEDEVFSSFQKSYLINYDRLNKSLDTFVEKNRSLSIRETFHANEFGLDESSLNKGTSYFIYEKDKIIYWSDNGVPLRIKNVFSNDEVVRLRNGWYQVVKVQEEERIYIATQLIKHEYSYQNKYLEDNFYKGFGISSSTGIEITDIENNFGIESSNKEVVFNLDFEKFEAYRSNSTIFLSLFSFLGLLICYILFVKSLSKN